MCVCLHRLKIFMPGIFLDCSTIFEAGSLSKTQSSLVGLVSPASLLWAFHLCIPRLVLQADGYIHLPFSGFWASGLQPSEPPPQILSSILMLLLWPHFTIGAFVDLYENKVYL